jgi:hypothetical protein
LRWSCQVSLSEEQEQLFATLRPKWSAAQAEARHFAVMSSSQSVIGSGCIRTGLQIFSLTRFFTRTALHFARKRYN